MAHDSHVGIVFFSIVSHYFFFVFLILIFTIIDYLFISIFMIILTLLMNRIVQVLCTGSDCVAKETFSLTMVNDNG